MSLDDLLAVGVTGDRVAFVPDGPAGDEVTVGYRQLLAGIDATTTGLIAAGVGPGDRVAWCGLNRVAIVEALFACARLGAILLPLNNRLAPAELAWQVDDADPALILTTDGFHATLAPVAGGRAVHDLDAQPFEPVPPGPRSDRTPQPATSPGPAATATATATDVLMVYTSGTTGHPKAAVHTANALRHTIANGLTWQGFTAEDRILAVLPTFHVGGLNIQVLPALAVGATVILHHRFDPGRALAAITTHRPSRTVFVPAMLTAVAAHPDFATTDLSCLTAIATGSSVVPAAAMAPFLTRGVPVTQVYGATETGPTVVAVPVSALPDPTAAGAVERATSAGLPVGSTGVRVVDPDTGRDQAAGTDGEVWIEGPNLFDRYWRNPEATAAAFVEGWYRTGDLGHLDADGWLWIADRRDDLIISGGENVYPAEVEQVLADHPAVAEVTVVGAPDQRWGRVPVAVVVPAPDTTEPLTVESLRAWCDGRLARFKHPHRVIPVDTLPRTSLGKVQKHLVRHQLGLD